HTRFSRDWSSDVCSSDLQRGEGGSSRDVSTPASGNPQAQIPLWLGRNAAANGGGSSGGAAFLNAGSSQQRSAGAADAQSSGSIKIGRASCRERGWIAVGD